MKKSRERPILKTDAFLGQKIQALRQAKEKTLKDVAYEVNVTRQQVEKMEAGIAFVALPMMEQIAEALGEPIPKRIIRRISNLRKIGVETEEQEEELMALYAEAFSIGAQEHE